MSDLDIKAIEIMSELFKKKAITVVLGSDGEIYFQRSHVANALDVHRMNFRNQLIVLLGLDGKALSLSGDSCSNYDRKFLTQAQIIDYANAKLKSHRYKKTTNTAFLKWIKNTDFFPNRKVDDTFNDDTPAQASIAIDSSVMGTVNMAVCPSCDAEYPINSDGSYEINKNGRCFRCQLKLISRPDDTPAQTFGTMLSSRYYQSHVKYNTYGKQVSQTIGNEMRLIGIAGQARAGKDTLASHMLCNLGDDWSRSSFADPLKNMLSVIGVDCSDESKAVIDDCFGVTPRHMMQTLGTEWGRHTIDNDIWVKAFARLNAGKSVIVPDVRFDNEADLVREHGVLIHLVGRGGIGGNHVSENPVGFKPGDIVIDNSRDLAWLYEQVDGNGVLGGFIDGVNE